MSLGWAVLVLVIYVLAAMRVTRLFNGDTITDPIRLWLAGRVNDYDRSEPERQRWATALYWINCPWCLGFWVCLASAYLPVHLIGWPWWSLFGVALATSHLIGVCARFADTEEITVEQAP